MNRKEMINAINDLYDENIDLKRENEYLNEKINKYQAPVEYVDTKEYDENTKKIINYGKEKMYKELVNGSNYVRVSRDEETKELKTTPFERWTENKIYSSYIPNDMSFNDVVFILYDLLQEEYEKEKTISIKEFEKEEANNGTMD